MVEAIPELTSEKSVAMFERFGVFTREELESRAEVKFENYAKTINIEAKSMINIASKRLIPAVISCTRALGETIVAVREAGVDEVSVQTELLREISGYLKESRAALLALIEIDDRAASMPEGREQAEYYHDRVIPAMEALRRPIDCLEKIVDKSKWPMPSYGDLLFGLTEALSGE